MVGIISFLVPGICGAGVILAGMARGPLPIPWVPGRWLLWILLGLFALVLIGCCAFTAWVSTADVVEGRRKDRRIELTLLLLLAQFAAVPAIVGLILVFFMI